MCGYAKTRFLCLETAENLTLSMLRLNFSRRQLVIILLFFTENRTWHFMQIRSEGEDFHEMPNPVFYEKQEKYPLFPFVVC